jgi:UDP-N-acetylglucosamine--dolichyl-phosphate N-acetylglucosaminephosphotransferase
MDGAIYLVVIVSFAATWITALKWIRKAPELGILGFDMNKPGRPKVAEMGAVCVVFGFVLSILIYIGLMTFWLHKQDYVEILAALCTVLSMCIISMMDDFLGWKKGLQQWQKPIFTLLAALPMMIINSGHSTSEPADSRRYRFGTHLSALDSTPGDSRSFKCVQHGRRV